MPLREDEAIPLRPVRLFGTHTHLVKVEDGEQICNREGTARMPRADRMDGAQCCEANFARRVLQLFNFHSSLLR